MNKRIQQAELYISQGKVNPNKLIKLLQPLIKKKNTPWKAYHITGIAYFLKQELDRAESFFERALEAGSESAEIFFFKGRCRYLLQDSNGAVEHLKRAAEIHPDYYDAWMALGDLLKEIGDLNGSLKCYGQCNRIDPKKSEVAMKIGEIYRDQGFLDKALEMFTIVLKMEPGHISAMNEKAKLYKTGQNYKKAEQVIKEAIEIDSINPNLRATHAEILKESGDFLQALDIYEKMLQDNPSFGGARVNYANILQDLGRFDEAEKNYLRANRDTPSFQETYSNYLFVQHYNPEKTKEEMLAALKKWDSIYAPESPERPVPEVRDKEKKLRIGLVSGGFRKHPVGWMIVAGLENLDQEKFELYFYSNHTQVDIVTKRLHKTSAQWRMISGFSDQKVNEMIREDQIDILVELSGHAAESRLRAVAMEPAPVIVKWVGGLINTTGLKAIDYLLTDWIETPEGVDSEYVEKLVRMPDDYICFTPPPDSPEVKESPLKENGFITFGCFNNPIKVNPVLLEKWAVLMKKIPDSRLFLKSKQYGNEFYTRRIEELMQGFGIPKERLIFEGYSPHHQLLEAYNRVDIALDPWPYSGGLTTCEALWMGVPVITCPGPTFAGRHAASHVYNAGFPEWIAESWEEYIQKVSELASDEEKLAELRAGLRDKVAASPLCDGKKFGAALGAAFQEMWVAYAEGRLKEDAIAVEVPAGDLPERSLDGKGDHMDETNGEGEVYSSRKSINQLSNINVLNGHGRIGNSRNFKDVIITNTEGMRLSLPENSKNLTTYVYLEQGNWYDPETSLMELIIEPGWTIWDVGAGFGAFSLPAAKATGEQGRVVAFEPVHSMREHLRMSKKLNGFEQIYIRDEAIGSGERNGTFKIKEVIEYSKLDQAEGLQVRIRTLDNIYHESGAGMPDLIKIDVNGDEIEVLRGADELLNDHEPVVLLSMEGGADPVEIWNILVAYGYETFQYLPALKLIHPCDIRDIATNKNLIALKNNSVRKANESGLIFHLDESADETVGDKTWLKFLKLQPWTASVLAGWKSVSDGINDEAEITYLHALNMICEAEKLLEQDKDHSKAGALFLKASTYLTDILNQRPDSLPVTLTLSRVLCRLDNRIEASRLLQNLTIRLFLQKQDVRVDLPFLLPMKEMEEEQTHPENLTNWIKVKVLEGWLFIKEWSAWFLTDEEKMYVKNLEGNPLAGQRTRKLHSLDSIRYNPKTIQIPNNKKATFIHIMFNHVYAKAFSDLVEYVNEHSDQDHRVFVNIHRAIPGYSADIDGNPFSQWFDSDKHLSLIIDKCSQPEVNGVFIHGLFFPWQNTLINELTGKKHLSWVIWGGDLYTPVKQGKPLFDLVEKIDSVTCNAGLDYFSEVYGKKRQFRFSYTYPGLYGNALNDKRIRKKNQIIVGNSGDPSNDHAGILDTLRRMSDIGEYKLLIPLSYNLDSTYLSVLKKKIESYGLSSQTQLITDFMPPDKYYSLMLESSMFITAHHRQQSMGNLLMSLYAGNGTFFRKNIQTTGVYEVNPTYALLKKLGFEFNIYEELVEVDSLGSFNIQMETIDHNRKLIRAKYGIETRALEMIGICEDLMENYVNI